MLKHYRSTAEHPGGINNVGGWSAVALCILAPFMIMCAKPSNTPKRVLMETLAIRPTADGMIVWNNETIKTQEMRPHLEMVAKEFHAVGFSARLLIEGYSDTPQSDIEYLSKIGTDAGFEIVDTARLNWPSPKQTIEIE